MKTRDISHLLSFQVIDSRYNSRAVVPFILLAERTNPPIVHHWDEPPILKPFRTFPYWLELAGTDDCITLSVGGELSQPTPHRNQTLENYMSLPLLKINGLWVYEATAFRRDPETSVIGTAKLSPYKLLWTMLPDTQ